MSVPVLLRRLPPLRDRPAEPGDPLSEKTRDGIHDGTRTASDVAAIGKLLVPASEPRTRKRSSHRTAGPVAKSVC
jgi:hypothetical protein